MLYLASASPRRRELLELLGVEFAVRPMDIPETPAHGETPQDYVQRLAREKAEACAAAVVAEGDDEQWAVLGADTIVVAGDHILEKPRDFVDYQQMMKQLSGRSHSVYTAVNVTTATASKTVLVPSEVRFRELTDEDIARYWNTGEPVDKAGGYGIQGPAGAFVAHLNGSFFAVMGLPLYETDQLLREFWRS
ncbi:septum formation inhibitor Maf [Aliidiomarina halalkaliphila]|uniref:dTTP/UTP pyrophosphatase n=1 Tax=Aliidiomarina halalkaliphila TaxID=2593535 RepID=A0A552X603_9GAMM|nr:Maf family protein [Aliidiomarina halalkaliphila]TRW50454.1 septum formation inhibitor Maf [Aliidiomarina halalkaliphila]